MRTKQYNQLTALPQTMLQHAILHDSAYKRGVRCMPADAGDAL